MAMFGKALGRTALLIAEHDHFQTMQALNFIDRDAGIHSYMLPDVYTYL